MTIPKTIKCYFMAYNIIAKIMYSSILIMELFPTATARHISFYFEMLYTYNILELSYTL